MRLQQCAAALPSSVHIPLRFHGQLQLAT